MKDSSIPRRGFDVSDDAAGNMWEQNRNGGHECRRRRQEVVFFTEVADDINHADFSDAAAVIDNDFIGYGVVVVACPDTDMGILGGLKGG